MHSLHSHVRFSYCTLPLHIYVAIATDIFTWNLSLIATKKKNTVIILSWDFYTIHLTGNIPTEDKVMHCIWHTVSGRGRTANMSGGFGEGSGRQRLTAEANSFTPLGTWPTKAGERVTWDAATSGRERPHGLTRQSDHLQPEPGVSHRQHCIPRNFHMPTERYVQHPAWESFLCYK